MREWLIDCELFLAKFLQFEERGSYKHICHTCSMNDASIFHCIDCDGASLYCSQCLLHSHSQNTLHRIEVSIFISQYVSPLHHSIRTSLLLILMESTLFPSTSTDVIHLLRTVFNCFVLAGIPPRSDFHNQLQHSMS